MTGAAEPEPEVVVGVVASPGPAGELAGQVGTELTELLRARLPGVRWAVRVLTERPTGAPTELAQVIDAVRQRLLAEGWNLAVCLTDLPLRTGRRPVVAHASVSHGVAVLSLPALGPVALTRRAPGELARLVAALTGDADRTEPRTGTAEARTGTAEARTGTAEARTGTAEARTGMAEARRRVADRRLREIGTRVPADRHGLGLVGAVIGGKRRLLAGVLRANRPWRLASRLPRALVAAFATGVFALVTVDIWELAGPLGAARMVLLAVGSVVALTLTILLGAGLLERVPPGAPARSPAREQAVLFNVATVLTVLLGVVALYLVLWVLTVIGSLLLVPAELLSEKTNHHAGAVDQIMLGWLASALATAGGALGVALESDATVREATYRYRPGVAPVDAAGTTRTG
ncbi:hypothetical protein AB0J86_14930 [Micromonospora sp. NPDC049559]|uniref:hypothetical protein n=1 Tax=Micromonospora sp. NPDC049559 TaxID=3155923 RepID=UPI00341590DA